VDGVSEQQGEPDAADDAMPRAEDRPAGESPRAVQVRIRRAPKYRSFVFAGAVVGVLLALITIAVLGDADSRFSPSTRTWYLAAIGLLIGGLLGGAIAVLVDRPRR
jgi:hypothetical protein